MKRMNPVLSVALVTSLLIGGAILAQAATPQAPHSRHLAGCLGAGLENDGAVVYSPADAVGFSLPRRAWRVPALHY